MSRHYEGDMDDLSLLNNRTRSNAFSELISFLAERSSSLSQRQSNPHLWGPYIFQTYLNELSEKGRYSLVGRLQALLELDSDEDVARQVFGVKPSILASWKDGRSQLMISPSMSLLALMTQMWDSNRHQRGANLTFDNKKEQ